jgi:hypothetical protein
MANEKPRTFRWIRWLARGLGLLFVAYWLFVGIAHAIGGDEPVSFESVWITVHLLLLMASFAISWWREGLGGALLTVLALAFSVFGYFSAGHNRGIAMLISGGPFLLVGVLTLVSWRIADGPDRSAGSPRRSDK